MIFKYQPKGQDEPKTWVIDLDDDFRSTEMEAIERRTELKFATTYRLGLMQKGALERRVMLWTLLRREHHALRFEDVDFTNKEVEIEMDLQEWGDLRIQIEKNHRLSDEQREEILAAIDTAMVDAPEAPGKASSPPSTPSEPSAD